MIEIHLRAIVLALMKCRHLLSTLQIHITEFFRPCLGQPSLSIFMSGLFELQVKDRIYIAPPATPGLIITAGAQKFIARFKRLVLLRGRANEEMWSKQQTLGMCFDMLRHTNKYRDISGRRTCRWRRSQNGHGPEALSGFRNP